MVKIEYTLSLEEYLEAINLHYKKGFRNLMMLVYIMMAVTFIVITTDYSDGRAIFRNYGALFFAISFYILLSKMIGKYQSKKLYEKSETLSKKTLLRISSKGIRVANNEKPISWSTFRKYKENDKYIILYTGIYNFKIIPKAVMNKNELNEFIGYLQKHIGVKTA
jgi:hypothetical protein